MGLRLYMHILVNDDTQLLGYIVTLFRAAGKTLALCTVKVNKQVLEVSSDVLKQLGCTIPLQGCFLAHKLEGAIFTSQG